MKTVINNMVIHRKDLSDTAFRLYCILAMIAWESNYQDGYVSINTLAGILGRTPETVQKLIKELEEKELVFWDSGKLLETTEWLDTPSCFTLRGDYTHYAMEYDPRYGEFTVDEQVLGEIIYPEAYALYKIFAMLAGGENSTVHTSIKELSKLFGKSPRVTRRWLKELEMFNIIVQEAPHIYLIQDSIRGYRY